VPFSVPLPASLSSEAKAEIKGVVDVTYGKLWHKFTLGEYISKGACVVASEDRASYVWKEVLSRAPLKRWAIASYTVKTGVHTFNLMTYVPETGEPLHWLLDTYVSESLQPTIVSLGVGIPIYWKATLGNCLYRFKGYDGETPEKIQITSTSLRY
jgi:hypothetical protein